MPLKEKAANKEEEKEKEKAGSDAGEEIDELPKISKKTKNKLENRVKKAPSAPRGVIYLGHIPKGFFEPQMKKYFEQFGTVTRLRLSRSKKSAHSKGYAFIEFEEEDVAQIVAETMSNYLLFGRSLVCHVVPKEKVHPLTFKIKGKMINTSGRRKVKARREHNERPSVSDGTYSVPVPTSGQVTRRRAKNEKAMAKLKAMGVEYDFDAVEPRAKKVKEEKVAIAMKKVKKDLKKAAVEATKKGKSDILDSAGDKATSKKKKKATDSGVAEAPTKAEAPAKAEKRSAPSPKVAIAKKRPKKA
eukprot:gnl/MRDRNA2_/MRDRNA2_93950_c0_seq1.p1 gnl/MRDRNA2_/MRDRNA2_93950_c0~~gnl/MRDRNA2_/MRDRNA2_93950_c0_seq1.p1  ORF type:complete len:301 (+),score=88.03 gnl/MRDRNA2_/MRDRNA2_93950_c0_seq1:62-964(+)